MPSLWGYTELLCATRSVPLPSGWLARPVAEGQAPLYQREGSRGFEGCLQLSRLIVMCRRIGTLGSSNRAHTARWAQRGRKPRRGCY